MKKASLNSWKSWIIAIACCLVYCLIVLVYRLSSLFYVELIDQYNIDRKTASIPFVVMGFIRCCSGFIFGMLGERFGLQRITYFGCYLSVLGVGLSYFAQNIITLSFTLGLIYGFGFTAVALLPSIIREHFDDTATTISNGFISVGPCITAIAFPALIIHFIDEYGVSGSFLLSAGVILNAIPLIMILKPRRKSSKFRTIAIEIEKSELHRNQDKIPRQFEVSDLQNIPLNNTENPQNRKIEEDENDELVALYEHKTSNRKVTEFFANKKVTMCSLHFQEDCHCHALPTTKNKSHPGIVCHDQANKELSNPLTNTVASQQNYDKTNISDSKHTNLPELESIYEQDKIPTDSTISKKKSFFYALNVLKDPAFIALSFVQGIFTYTFSMWLTTMIDYSRDKGIDRSYEIYILTLNPITDIFGRLGLAWVTDKGYLSISNFCALLYILLAISSICMAVAEDFAIMILGILVMTFAIGAFLSIYPGMSYAFIEKDKQAVSVASIGLFYAPLSFTVAPVIGYFRGKLGSYDGLFYLLAVMNIFCSIIVLILPKLANRREKRKLKKLSKR